MFDDFIIKIYLLECLHTSNLHVGILKLMAKLSFARETFHAQNIS